MFPEGFRHHAHKLNVGFEGSPEVSWFEGVDVRNNNKALGNAASTKKRKREVYIDTCACYSIFGDPHSVIGDNFQPALD